MQRASEKRQLEALVTAKGERFIITSDKAQPFLGALPLLSSSPFCACVC